MKLLANGIDIEIEDTHAGDTTVRPVVLLIMGLGMQLVAWPPALVQSLVDAGYRVLRLDNRDIGLSQKFDHLGMPNLLWEGLKYKLGLPVKSPYSLADMAADTLAVLDALGVAKAHLVGVSMGGMIAQRVAIAAPERVLSLTSIMSSSGARGLPQAKPQVMRVLMSRPAGKDRESVLNHYVKLFKAIGSPGFPMDDAELRGRIAAAAQRSFYPAGTVRQMAAIAADGKRAHALGTLRVPTLVIHGKADPLVPYACGEDTARRIPGARLVGIEGMGHDLPSGVVQRILEPLIPHLHTSTAQ
ncbi:MAG: alpha/beta fold hydrolase [Pseudomonadota bacterium]|uniref:alpha/beta fold hydrolase n=1 Tax=Polaromonas sp. TaxID=1869339 RepID=UPI00182F5921|nr:alpha/beta fold hydrolase [Polaromonas sp.]MBA3593724.1 alpha/beta fold hydrolase [Polaromonas sp.]MDQ3271199.1 alpha/beta fold hydrolase [Pseudomonadota bacterium]